MAKKYVVTGAYVTVKTMTIHGPRIIGLHSGAPWPDDAEAAATQHHLDSNLIKEVPEPEPVEAPTKAASAKPATAGAAAKGDEGK